MNSQAPGRFLAPRGTTKKLPFTQPACSRPPGGAGKRHYADSAALARRGDARPLCTAAISATRHWPSMIIA